MTFSYIFGLRRAVIYIGSGSQETVCICIIHFVEVNTFNVFDLFICDWFIIELRSSQHFKLLIILFLILYVMNRIDILLHLVHFNLLSVVLTWPVFICNTVLAVLCVYFAGQVTQLELKLSWLRLSCFLQCWWDLILVLLYLSLQLIVL